MTSATNESRSKAPRTILAILLLLLLFFFLFSGGGTPFSYIREQAKALDFDQVKIVRFVQEEVKREMYPGSFRGALGTLWGAAGNEEDSAQLLSALLAVSRVENDLVKEGERFGVRLRGSNEVIMIDEASGASTAETVQKASNFSITMLSGKSGEEGATYEGKVGDFLRAPLRVSISGNLATLRTGAGESLLETSLMPGLRLVMRISFSFPDGSFTTVRRELAPGGEEHLAIPSEHVVVFAPCTINATTYEKQTELLNEEWGEGSASSRSYALALDHWYRSDLALVDLKSFFETEAFYSTPRVLIGSTFLDSETEEQVGYALDLRRNGIHVPAGDEVADSFAITRSTLEAELEAKVISEATGMRGVSAIDVFLSQLGEGSNSSASRLSGYALTMSDFLRDTHPGTKLKFSLNEDAYLSLKHLPESRGVGIELSEALESHRKSIKGLPWELTKAGEATPERFEELAFELEALLGSAAGNDTEYAVSSEIEESYEVLKTSHVRSFSYKYNEEQKKHLVAHEFQITSMNEDGSYAYHGAEHYHAESETWKYTAATFPISAETYRNGHGYSHFHWTLAAEGRNAFALGLSAYRELKDQGHTEIIPYLVGKGNNAHDPLKMYLVDTKPLVITINQKEVSVPALWVGGGPASENSERKEWDKIELLDDPATREPADGFNRFVVMDDPEFPRFMDDGSNEEGYTAGFQTSVPGKLRSASNGFPVYNAEVTVEKTKSKGKSWPTGDFMLPIIQKPFEIFTVTVRHPDFEPWSEELDFRERETFDRLREIRLTPRAKTDAFVWVEPEAIEAGLSKVSDEQTKRFIREAMEDNPSLQAMVPLNGVPHGMGIETAWLLFDRETSHITAVTSDGLHGAVGMVKDKVQEAAEGAGQNAISAYGGFISSWYVYSAGKLEALNGSMFGGDFDDLGHAHAKAFAMNFLKKMLDGLDNYFAEQVGANKDAYKEGFLRGLAFFDQHPEYRGE